MLKPNIEIYTYGACANNPGKGGYGVVLRYEFSVFLEIEKLLEMKSKNVKTMQTKNKITA